MSEKFREAIKAAAEMTQEQRNEVFGRKTPADIRELLTAESIAAYREQVIEECARKLEWLVIEGRTINEAIPIIRALKS